MARPRRSRKPPAINWKGTERDYRKDLNKVVALINRLVREQLIPQLGPLAEQQQSLLGLDSPLEDVDHIFDNIRLEFEREFTDDEAKQLAQKHGARGQGVNQGQVKAQMRSLGINVFTESPGLTQTMEGFNRANTKLIKSLSTTAYTRMEGVVERAFREGQSTSKILATLQGEFRITKNRAKLIARDQMGKLNGQLTRERHLANGITKSVWIDAGDERVRDEHEDRNGREFDNTKGINGEFPGGPIACRCYASPLPPGS